MRRILIENKVVEPRECSFGLPWRSDASCFNFRSPDECVPASDIEKITDKDNIETLVIGSELESYDFISDMVNLKYLFIYKGETVTGLDFVRKLVRLQQLYIDNTHISDLSPLYPLLKEKERLKNNEPNMMKATEYMVDGICIRTDCEIADAYKLHDGDGIYISELIIGNKRIKPRRR